jgi:hypothetical protein
VQFDICRGLFLGNNDETENSAGNGALWKKNNAAQPIEDL